MTYITGLPRALLITLGFLLGGCGAAPVVTSDLALPVDAAPDLYVVTAADCPAAQPVTYDPCPYEALACNYNHRRCECVFHYWSCYDPHPPDIAGADLASRDAAGYTCDGGVPPCAITAPDHRACTTPHDVCAQFRCREQCQCVGPENLWLCCGSLSGNICDPNNPPQSGDLCCPNQYVGGCNFNCGGPVRCDCVQNHFQCAPRSCAPVDAGIRD